MKKQGSSTAQRTLLLGLLELVCWSQVQVFNIIDLDNIVHRGRCAPPVGWRSAATGRLKPGRELRANGDSRRRDGGLMLVCCELILRWLLGRKRCWERRCGVVGMHMCGMSEVAGLLQLAVVVAVVVVCL